MIAESKLPSAAVVIVNVALAPWATLIDAGDALMVKSAFTTDEVTVRLIVVVCVTPPPTPETVMA